MAILTGQQADVLMMLWDTAGAHSKDTTGACTMDMVLAGRARNRRHVHARAQA
jgi:hypothetical protein